MIKIIHLLILFLFILNCSLDTKTGFWSHSEKLKSEKNSSEEKLFADVKIYQDEFNPDLKIKLKNNFKKKSFVNNLLNNNGIVDFSGELKKFLNINFQKLVNLIIINPNYYLQKIIL